MDQPQFPFPDFQEIPVFDSKAKIELTGTQFEAIFNFLSVFTPAINAVNRAYHKALEQGKIKLEYRDEQGNLVPDEKLKAHRQKVQEYFTQMQAMNQPSETIKKEEIEIVSE